MIAVLVIWLLAALIVGASGRLQGLRPPVPQAIIFGLAAIVLGACLRVSALRQWITALDIRWLVGLHISRFVGIYFLFLSGRGELARSFALPAGWGDIVVATGALALVLTGPASNARRKWFTAWNLAGQLDILLVVLTAARIWMTEPEAMVPLLRLPLSLLPTFLVPLIIASHVILFARLFSRSAAAA